VFDERHSQRAKDVVMPAATPRLLNAVVVTYLIFVVAMMLFDDVLGPARWLP
jgi:hypothetical protein